MTIRDRRMLSRSIVESEKVAKLSDLAALLYTWNISHLDDQGRGDATVFFLKRTILGNRDCTKDDVARFRTEIINVGLMVPYSVNEKDYWYMPKKEWEYHQRGSWHGKAKVMSKFPSPSPNTNNNGFPETPKTDGNGVQENQLHQSPGQKEKELELEREKEGGEENLAPGGAPSLEDQIPPILLEIDQLTDKLYSTGIFPKAKMFVNLAFSRNKEPEAIAQALRQCLKEKRDDAMAYCMKVLKLENPNARERRIITEHQREKEEERHELAGSRPP